MSDKYVEKAFCQYDDFLGTVAADLYQEQEPNSVDPYEVIQLTGDARRLVGLRVSKHEGPEAEVRVSAFVADPADVVFDQPEAQDVPVDEIDLDIGLEALLEIFKRFEMVMILRDKPDDRTLRLKFEEGLQ